LRVSDGIDFPIKNDSEIPLAKRYPHCRLALSRNLLILEFLTQLFLLVPYAQCSISISLDKGLASPSSDDYDMTIVADVTDTFIIKVTDFMALITHLFSPASK